MKELSPLNATGLDGISVKILEETAETICIPLAKLIHLSLSKGKVPLLWKQANAIHKKLDKSTFGKYIGQYHY